MIEIKKFLNEVKEMEKIYIEESERQAWRKQ